MTIQEAIKSGKPFRRPGYNYFLACFENVIWVVGSGPEAGTMRSDDQPKKVALSPSAIFADDWYTVDALEAKRDAQGVQYGWSASTETHGGDWRKIKLTAEIDPSIQKPTEPEDGTVKEGGKGRGKHK